MLKNTVFLLAGFCVCTLALGQVKKQFTVENSSKCERIKLTIEARSGTCLIRPSQYPDILNVYSNLDASDYSQNFSREIHDQICDVVFTLDDMPNGGLSDAIGDRVFSGPREGKFWRMYLTDSKPYSLEFNCGMGNANIDLSGLSINTMKVHTGSANVNVGYFSGAENKIEMDTFFVKVDWGSIYARNLNAAHAKNVFADVGFGDLMLDLSKRPFTSNTIRASLGAGNLLIVLPEETTPMLIRIRSSWLCSVHGLENFRQVNENTQRNLSTFVNKAYSRNANNSLTFNLDVSMGSIVFQH